MLVIRKISEHEYFGFWISYIYARGALGMGTKCKHEIHFCFLYTLYTLIILYSSFKCAYVLFEVYHMRSNVAFSTCTVILALKKYQILEDLGGMMDAQPALPLIVLCPIIIPPL
jgi:hypothetical protein